MAIHVLFTVGVDRQGPGVLGRQTGPMPFLVTGALLDGMRAEEGASMRRDLALKCQEALGSKQPSQAWQVMGAVARVEAATRMDRPHGQAAAIRLLERRAVPLV